MIMYYPRNYSKTPQEHEKELIRLKVRLWKYEKQWLEFVPDGVPPLSFEELKDLRDKLPEAHRFAFAKIGKTFSCDNRYGGLLLMKHGYIPVFESEENNKIL